MHESHTAYRGEVATKECGTLGSNLLKQAGPRCAPNLLKSKSVAWRQLCYGFKVTSVLRNEDLPSPPPSQAIAPRADQSCSSGASLGGGSYT